MKEKTLFKDVKQFPEDPILHLPILFSKDPHAKKVNLGIGVYRDEKGAPYVFSSVKKAEKKISEREVDKEYLPIVGDVKFLQCIEELIFEKKLSHSFATQTVGGTSALFEAAFFLARNGYKRVYLSDPTWPNHHLIFSYAGCEIKSYAYYDSKLHHIALEKFYADIEKIEDHSILLLHASCHNPTGQDLSGDEWKRLASILTNKKIVPVFDLAYHGLGDSIQEDVKGLKAFLEANLEFFVCYSCAKNFGLYGERVGALIVVGTDSTPLYNIETQIKQMIRSTYSNPPKHGAKIVSEILSSKNLQDEWSLELINIKKRLSENRKKLVQKVNFDLSFIEKQKGIFSYTDLSPEKVQQLKDKFGVYLAMNGRINVAGLTDENIDYVAQALSKVHS